MSKNKLTLKMIFPHPAEAHFELLYDKDGAVVGVEIEPLFFTSKANPTAAYLTVQADKTPIGTGVLQVSGRTGVLRYAARKTPVTPQVLKPAEPKAPEQGGSAPRGDDDDDDK